MKLEEQVSSLVLSKKLKELGVKQESFFHWVIDILYLTAVQPIEEYKHNFASAFTVAELGEMLPVTLGAANDNPATKQIDVFSYKYGDEKYQIELSHYPIYGDAEQPLWNTGICKTEADARAKMLVYLIEAKIIEM